MKNFYFFIVTLNLGLLFTPYCSAQNQAISHQTSPVKPETSSIKTKNSPYSVASWGPLAENSHWNFTGYDENNETYRYFSKISEGEYRYEFIQRKMDKKPIMFYKHERMISFTLDHQNHLLLINDSAASKFNQVAISDLNHQRYWLIDQKVKDHYFKHLFPKTSKPFPSSTPDHTEYEVKSWTLPFGIGFSPDDRQVLIHMAGIMEFAWSGDPQEDAKLKSHYKDWSYVIDPMDGRILKIYKTKDVPTEWWKF